MSAEHRLSRLQRRARSKRIPCTLTVENVAELMASTCCSICGAAFSKALPMTFERRNPLLGYTRRNTTAACIPCNTGKGGVIDRRAHDLQRRDKEVRSLVDERNAIRVSRGRNG